MASNMNKAQRCSDTYYPSFFFHLCRALPLEVLGPLVARMQRLKFGGADEEETFRDGGVEPRQCGSSLWRSLRHILVWNSSSHSVVAVSGRTYSAAR